MEKRKFSSTEMRAIADALGETDTGLTGTEIAEILAACQIPDIAADLTKRHRIYEALSANQVRRGDRKATLGFIRKAIQPGFHLRKRDRFEPLRLNLNRALSLCGLHAEESGNLVPIQTAKTINEADERARRLRSNLESRSVHEDVLRYCRAELIQDNYFHAVLEAVKSIAAKLRDRTGIDSDGGELVDRTLCGSPPMLAINPHKTRSQKDEQKGFANLVKGTFGMFRNPTAHEARLHWDMGKADAEDLMSIVSLIHRRLDEATMLPRS